MRDKLAAIHARIERAQRLPLLAQLPELKTTVFLLLGLLAEIIEELNALKGGKSGES